MSQLKINISFAILSYYIWSILFHIGLLEWISHFKCDFLKNLLLYEQLEMATCVCNSGIWEAEVRASQVWDPTGLHSKILSYKQNTAKHKIYDTNNIKQNSKQTQNTKNANITDTISFPLKDVVFILSVSVYLSVSLSTPHPPLPPHPHLRANSSYLAASFWVQRDREVD